jgi:hypothetical protein
MSFEIRYVGKGLVDVFTGKGWNNWSRFELKDRKIVLVKGQPVSKEVYKQLWSELL